MKTSATHLLDVLLQVLPRRRKDLAPLRQRLLPPIQTQTLQILPTELLQPPRPLPHLRPEQDEPVGGSLGLFRVEFGQTPEGGATALGATFALVLGFVDVVGWGEGGDELGEGLGVLFSSLDELDLVLLRPKSARARVGRTKRY